MANVVEIILRATDQASATLKNANKNVEGMGATAKLSMTALMGMAGAVAIVGKEILDLGNEYVTYTRKIQMMSANIGISTEETSRLANVSENLGVELGTLESALQMAVKRGYEPSIDGLAKLADETNAIADPVKRAAALVEIFGRNWTSLTPILTAGGDEIRKLAAETGKSELVTGQSIKKANELFRANTALADSYGELKLAIGGVIAMPLGGFIGEVVGLMGVLQLASEGLQDHTLTIRHLTTVYDAVSRGGLSWASALKILTGIVDGANQKAEDTGWILNRLSPPIKNVTEETEDLTLSIGKMSEAWTLGVKAGAKVGKALDDTADKLAILDASLSGAISEDMKNFSKQQADLALKIRITTGKIADLEKKKYLTKDQQKDLDELKTQLGELNGEFDTSAAEHEKMVNKMIFDSARLKLAEGGYTDAEITMLQNLATQMGLTSSADETMALLMIAANQRLDKDQSLVMYMKKVNELAAALNSVPTGVDVTVWLRIISSISEGKVAPPPPSSGGRAAGGPVSAGTPYVVGEAGPELFVPNRSGTIVPNGAAGGINLTINAYGLDENALAQAVVMRLNSMARVNRASGRAYAGRG